MIKLNKKKFTGSIVAICAIILLFCTGCAKETVIETSDTIVFLGDSITSSYDTEYYFPDYPVINSGVWGDRTDNAQERLESDVYAYDPKKVFILLGINDVGYGRTNEDVTSRIEDIVSDIQDNCPGAELYLISVYPMNVSDFESTHAILSGDINDVVEDLNTMLEVLADDMDINYLDVAQYLKDENGELKYEYALDGLHVTDAAYEVISDVLVEYFN